MKPPPVRKVRTRGAPDHSTKHSVCVLLCAASWLLYTYGGTLQLVTLWLFALAFAVTSVSDGGAPSESNEVSSLRGELPDAQLQVPSKPGSDEQRDALIELRKRVRASLGTSACDATSATCLQEDSWCCRFLVSASWQPDAAAPKVVDTLRWRAFRKPIAPLKAAPAEHLALLRAACATGTIACPGVDRHGRGLICIDNSAAPVGPFDGQVRLLAFTIEFALRQCVAPCNKICFLFKLSSFSTQNQPAISESLEAVRVLIQYYPQLIGSAVLYQVRPITTLLRCALPNARKKADSSR